MTTLIIRHYHETSGHVGVQQVLATIRERYSAFAGSGSLLLMRGFQIFAKRK